VTSWKVATSWIKQCVQYHSNCTASSRNRDFIPTRLIDVGLPGSSDAPKLYISDATKSSGIEYVTLSHCWGKKPILRLLTTNIECLQARIPTKQLPRTFQQAIILTKKMGHRYIWIDSLCILQDSEIDWNREASLMGDVYKHSFCNISATAAEDGRAGLIFPRNPLLISPCEIEVTSKSTASIKKGLYRVVDMSLWEREIDAAPLNTRGWVFQERFLAPRKLSFGAKQLFWECAEFQASESFPEGLPGAVEREWFRVSNDSELRELFIPPLPDFAQDSRIASLLWECGQRRASLPFPEGLSEAQKGAVYQALLQSDRFKKMDVNKLVDIDLILLFPEGSTYKSDGEIRALQLWLTLMTGTRPFDIGGNTFTHFGDGLTKITPNTYRLWNTVLKHYAGKKFTQDQDRLVALSGVAKWFQGLFKDEVYLAGHWKSYLINQLLWEVSPHTESSRPHQYRAPSWSWASVEGQVGFRDIVESDNQKLLAKIMNAKVVTWHGDPTGTVLHGFIKVEGKLMSVPWAKTASETRQRKFSAKLTKGYVTGYSDVSGEYFLPQESVCLPIQASLSLPGSKIFSATLEGLVLQPTGDMAGAYKRIGWFAAYNDGARFLKESWDDQEKLLVLIV
jgi:Heterokaryon incompatibility protein (HET)